MKSKIGIIIGREFKERVHKKSFIITTLLTPIFIIALMVAPVLISEYSDGDQKIVVVVDDSNSNIIASQLQSNEAIQFSICDMGIDEARRTYTEEEAILHIGKDIINNPADIRIYSNGAGSYMLESNIASQVTSAVANVKLAKYNDDNLPKIIADISTPVTLQSFKNNNDEGSDGAAQSSSSIVAMIMAYLLGFLLYMILLLYGNMVMQSVIEEKNNRVLEVMVSSVRPFDMMMGKIFGIASVALLQLAIWGIMIFIVGYFVIPAIIPESIADAVAMLRAGATDVAMEGNADMDLIQAIVTLTDVSYLAKIFCTLILFVFGGFLLYAAMFAAVGSSVDSVQDAQQLQTPITMPIILALIMMITAMNDPSSDVAFWFSMVPLTSPIVMMARIPYDIPIWEIAVSLAILYATFIIVVWGAAKIYRVGILMYGKKPTFKELWKWIKYKY